jgi:hypothetical protein
MQAPMILLWSNDRSQEGFIILLIMGSLRLCHVREPDTYLLPPYLLSGEQKREQKEREKNRKAPYGRIVDRAWAERRQSPWADRRQPHGLIVDRRIVDRRLTAGRAG